MAVLTTELLRECLGDLEGAVLETTDRRTRISRIRWERYDGESSYDTYRVTVSFHDRADRRVFLKDYGSVQQAKDNMPARRERELHVYRNVLPHAALGTARFYGAIWDHARARYWLCLEFVEGTPLKFCDFEYWTQAAAWLGRLHGYFAQHPERLQPAHLLVDHDERYFLTTAERALRSVHELLPAAARRLGTFVARYQPLAALLSSQPKTLVHGAFRPGQILVDPQRQPARFCPVDWELAALGSSIHDLAFLADGFRPPRLDRVLDAYRGEAVTYGIHVPAADELKHIVNVFRLHRTFSWLSNAVERHYPAPTVSKLATMAQQVAASVLDS